MTNIASGSEQVLFRRKGEVVDYILKNVLANKNRKIGTELEMFLIDQNGKAITRDNGQKAFAEFKSIFALKGYESSFIYEQDAQGTKTIFGLDVRNLGTITPEIGHQFEFACTVCQTTSEIQEKNDEFYSAIYEVAARLKHTPVFCGHIHGYVGSTEGSYRSRSVEWHNYFDKRFGNASMNVCESLDATASTQVSIDSGSEKFHEFFQALLLIEPALTIHYANSQRPHISVDRLPASHIKPIVGAWHTRSPREALNAIVDRLMQLEVPFLPDPEYPQIYRAEPLIGHCPPTVEDLMLQGRLNERTLNNVGGFLLSRPAIRRFSQGLLEMRGVDAQSTPEKVAEVARCVETIVYNDRIREELLSDYAHLSALDLLTMHRVSAMEDRDDALHTLVAGTRMIDFIDDILDRSQPEKSVPISLPSWENRAFA
ncbi:MAG TPA: hypothetical protein DCY07_00785 [Rhodospirillaceae bacterium]|nr:hypothetical protein [Rhodospirillaceae bacterium]